MREKWAKRIALLTCVILVLLAGLFANSQNPVKTTTEARKSADIELLRPPVNKLKMIEEGRKIYREQGCAGCHSIGGKGNPRNPLDNVGQNRTIEELRAGITGKDGKKKLPPSAVLRLKKNYKKLSSEELNALILYLKSAA